MKQKLFSVCLVLLLCVTGCKNQIPTNPSVSTPLSSTNVSSTDTPSADPNFIAEFTATEQKLVPPEQNFSDEFNAELKKLTDAVRGKNLTVIDGYLDSETMVDFGGNSGKAAFYEHWNLNKSPEKSHLWAELEKILALGGTYDEQEKTFIAPYTFSNFPAELDVFEHHIITGKDIKMYAEKSLESTVAESLSYNIIKALDGYGFFDKSDDAFIGIKTLAGTQGYVQKKHIRSPIDYRLSILYKNGGWKLTYMVSGD